MNTVPRQVNSARIREWAAQMLAQTAVAARSAVELSVAECMPVFEIKAERVRGATPDTWYKALQWNRQWHCQINQADSPAGSARVAEADAELPLQVLSWSSGGIAIAVHQSLAQADAQLDSDLFEAVLVEIPPLGLTALFYVPRAPETRTFVSLLRSSVTGMRAPGSALIALEDALGEIAALPFVRGGYLGTADQDEPGPGS